MKKYIIDGNNLIGKTQSLSNLQKKDRQASREKLTFLIDRHFANKKLNVVLNFDGFANQPINVTKIKLVYSDNKSADEKIKQQIEFEKNKKNIIVVSSDNNVCDFARVCSCEIMSSEDFGRELMKTQNENDEESKIKEIDDIDTFKKIFGV